MSASAIPELPPLAGLRNGLIHGCASLDDRTARSVVEFKPDLQRASRQALAAPF